jgi:hypothetical protein
MDSERGYSVSASGGTEMLPKAPRKKSGRFKKKVAPPTGKVK